MQRKIFDLIMSGALAIVTAVLLVAGGLLMWGHSFAESNVHSQLARQEIVIPAAGQLTDPRIRPYLAQYAGQELTTGPQALAYADHYIAVHLSEMPYGGVYSKISAAAMAQPGNAKLAALKTTSFQGTTLRGLLLEAYAFWKFGQIALWAAIASFIGAGVLGLLAGFGFWHARRVPAAKELLAHDAHPHAAPQAA